MPKSYKNTMSVMYSQKYVVKKTKSMPSRSSPILNDLIATYAVGHLMYGLCQKKSARASCTQEHE